jgi:hypothetical protein
VQFGWQSKPTGFSWTPEESQVENCEHQDNANIHYRPFPESVSEEHEIYTDYDGDHRHHVKHDSYLSAHFSLPATSDPTTYLDLVFVRVQWSSIFRSSSIARSSPPLLKALFCFRYDEMEVGVRAIGRLYRALTLLAVSPHRLQVRR